MYLHANLWLYYISLGFDSVLRNRKWISNKMSQEDISSPVKHWGTAEAISGVNSVWDRHVRHGACETLSEATVAVRQGTIGASIMVPSLFLLLNPAQLSAVSPISEYLFTYIGKVKPCGSLWQPCNYLSATADQSYLLQLLVLPASALSDDSFWLSPFTSERLKVIRM